MNSWGIAQRLVKEFERMRETEIRILDPQRRCRGCGQGLGEDDGGAFGEAGCGGILLVGSEGDFRRAGLLDAVEAGDFGIDDLDTGDPDTEGAVIEARVEGGGDLGEFHGRWMDASKSYTKETGCLRGAPSFKRDRTDAVALFLLHSKREIAFLGKRSGGSSYGHGIATRWCAGILL